MFTVAMLAVLCSTDKSALGFGALNQCLRHAKRHSVVWCIESVPGVVPGLHCVGAACSCDSISVCPIFQPCAFGERQRSPLGTMHMYGNRLLYNQPVLTSFAPLSAALHTHDSTILQQKWTCAAAPCADTTSTPHQCCRGGG
jgi:hypothetical protein